MIASNKGFRLIKKADKIFLIFLVISLLIWQLMSLKLVDFPIVVIGLVTIYGIIFELIRIKKDSMIKKKERGSVLLKDNAIRVYTIVYLTLSIVLDYKLLKLNFLVYLVKIMFSTWFLFYGGLYGIKTRKGWLRGFPMTQSLALAIGVISVILALLALIFI